MNWWQSLTEPLQMWWEVQTDQWTGKAPPGAKRSAGWAACRKAHLQRHPRCECCGGRKTVRVHHIEPFHLNPERELDPTNLMTLCEAKKYGINCHLLIGHLGNWSRWNPLAWLNAKQWKIKLSGRCSRVAEVISAWQHSEDSEAQ